MEVETILQNLHTHRIFKEMKFSNYISSILPLDDDLLCITSSGGIDICQFDQKIFNIFIKDYISHTKIHEKSIFLSVKNELKMIDSRSKSQMNFQSKREISTFDTYENLIAVGSNLLDNESHISFYDQRYLKDCIVTFDQVHSDDITVLKFVNANSLVSGSTDGLINTFNLSSFNEEEDLTYVLKFDSVYKIGFFENYLWASSHIETLRIWDFDGNTVNST